MSNEEFTDPMELGSADEVEDTEAADFGEEGVRLANNLAKSLDKVEKAAENLKGKWTAEEREVPALGLIAETGDILVGPNAVMRSLFEQGLLDQVEETDEPVTVAE